MYNVLIIKFKSPYIEVIINTSNTLQNGGLEPFNFYPIEEFFLNFSIVKMYAVFFFIIDFHFIFSRS